MGGNPPALATIPTIRTVTGGPSARAVNSTPACGSPATRRARDAKKATIRRPRRVGDLRQRGHRVEVYLLGHEVAAVENIDVAGRVRGEKPRVCRVGTARADGDRDRRAARHAHEQHKPEPAAEAGPQVSAG